MLTFYYSIARKQSLKERKVPQDKKSLAMPWLYLTVFLEIEFIFFLFLLFWLSVNKKVIITGMTLQIENYNKKSERIIKRTPK